MQFGLYLWPNRQNSCILYEIGVSKHDDEVKFLTGSGNMAVSHMRNEKICNLALIYGRIAKIPESFRKFGSGNTIVTLNF